MRRPARPAQGATLREISTHGTRRGEDGRTALAPCGDVTVTAYVTGSRRASPSGTDGPWNGAASWAHVAPSVASTSTR